MDRDSLNIVQESKTVSAYMARPENKLIWQPTQAITDVMAAIDGDIAALGGVETKQQAPVLGPAAAKAVLRHDYEDDILRIAAGIFAFAAKTNNLELEAQVDLTFSGLEHLSGEDLVAAGDRIANLVTANVAGLVAYNITATDATLLGTYKTQFQAKETKPREAVVDRSKETKQIAPLIRNLRSLLNRQLDKLMLGFKKTNPEFYAGYLTARVIIDRGHPKKKKTTPAKPTP